jgi:hypothetical protein
LREERFKAIYHLAAGLGCQNLPGNDHGRRASLAEDGSGHAERLPAYRFGNALG